MASAGEHDLHGAHQHGEGRAHERRPPLEPAVTGVSDAVDRDRDRDEGEDQEKPGRERVHGESRATSRTRGARTACRAPPSPMRSTTAAPSAVITDAPAAPRNAMMRARPGRRQASTVAATTAARTASAAGTTIAGSTDIIRQSRAADAARVAVAGADEARRTGLPMSPRARTSLEARPHEKTNSAQRRGTLSYRRSMFDMPPPSTMTSGSSTLMMACQRARHALLVARQRRLRVAVARRRPLDDLGRQQTLARAPLVVRRHAGSRQERFDAAVTPAVAGRSGHLVGLGPRQRVVSPLARNRIRTRQQMPAHDNAGTGAGADDDSEDDLGVRTGAISRFRHRKAVRVVGDPHGPPKTPLEILEERLSDQPGGVGVLDEAGGGRNRARDTHADARRDSGFGIRSGLGIRPRSTKCSTAATRFTMASTVAR